LEEIQVRKRCENCGNFHEHSTDCRYLRLRPLFGELDKDEDNLLRWLAGMLDSLNEQTFLSLIRKRLNN
jgi:hypothetical protein